MTEKMLVVRDLIKVYPGQTEPAVKGVSFEADRGEFVSLLGPSGCGKTTTLRSIAGLETVTGGYIEIGGELVSDADTFVPPDRREIGMVFQSYALWPHMTALDNVAYPLRRRGTRKGEAREQARSALVTVGLEGLEDRYPHELSGGQQQRVAVARAGVGEPALLLFDEPLSNLDARLREQMRFELRELQQRLGVTSIYVTHDQAEAMVLSDRIILMNEGLLMQSGSPADLYRHPETPWAASFLGSVNLVEAVVESVQDDGMVRVKSLLGRSTVTAPRPVTTGDEVQLAIRPQYLDLVPDPNGASLTVTVTETVFLGESVEYTVELAGRELTVIGDRPFDVAQGQRVGLLADETGMTCLRPDRGQATTDDEEALDTGASSAATANL